MKLRISHPGLAPDLVDALNKAECVAAQTASDTVEVFLPWLLEGSNTAHAAMELLFFVRAWASDHPAFRATVLDAG